MKTCTKCGEDKPLSEFHRSRGARDGRRARCKVCTRADLRAAGYSATLRAADPEGTRAYHSAHHRVRAARGRAAAQGGCVHPGCDRPATDWALDPAHPTVQRSARYAWSDDPEAYRPKCRSCNKTEDNAAKREVTA